MSEGNGDRGNVLRLPMQLGEALLACNFNPSQTAILLGLVRLTYGWKRRTVTISQSELAAYVGVKASGTFRSALAELIANRVVRIVAGGGGNAKTTYALEPDVTQWLRWATHPDALAARFGVKPESHDEWLEDGRDPAQKQAGGLPENRQGGVPENRQGGRLETGRGGAQKQAGTLPENGQSAGEGAQKQAGGVPENRQGTRAHEIETRDGGLGSSFSQREILTPSTDQPPPTSNPRERASPPDAAHEFATRLTVRANQGLAAHATRPQPIARVMAGGGATREAAEAIVAAGVPLPFAERAVFDIATSHNADGEVRTLKYFVPGVLRAWEQHNATKIAEAEPAPEPAPSSASTSSRRGVGGRAFDTALRAARIVGATVPDP